MKLKTLKMIEGIVCLVMPCILAITVIFELWYLPIITFFLVIIMFGILVSRAKEVLEDEFTRVIREKGAKAAMLISSLAMVLAGMILLGISGDNASDMGKVAITLFATATGLNIIGYFTHLYYKNKLGGKL
jgi:uncharacterized membrane protein